MRKRFTNISFIIAIICGLLFFPFAMGEYKINYVWDSILMWFFALSFIAIFMFNDDIYYFLKNIFKWED